MASKKIKSNSFIIIRLNKKMGVSLEHIRFGKQDAGYPGGLSKEIVKKNSYIKKLSFWGEVSDDIIFTGALGKNSELIYFPEGANRFKQIQVNLYKREVDEDSIGSFDLENYYTYEDEEETVPPKAFFSFSISSELFETLENKYLDKDKNFLENLAFNLGVYYDENHDPINYEAEETLMSGWITSYSISV